MTGVAAYEPLRSGVLASLAEDDDGIWHAPPSDTDVSYPADGHAFCLGVEDTSFWFRHRNDCISALVARHPPRGFILDVGGGNGFVARRLIDEGHPCVLLEPGLHGARNARRLRKLPWVLCARLEQLRLQPNTLSAISLFDVVEHVVDDRSFIATVANLLSPGGHLYLTVPMHAWLWSRADEFAGHQRRYTRESMASLLSPHFELLYSTAFFSALLPAIAMLRALPYRIAAGRTAAVMSTEAEHGRSGGLATRVLARALAPEAGLISAGRHLPFGASLIVAARKPS